MSFWRGRTSYISPLYWILVASKTLKPLLTKPYLLINSILAKILNIYKFDRGLVMSRALSRGVKFSLPARHMVSPCKTRLIYIILSNFPKLCPKLSMINLVLVKLSHNNHLYSCTLDQDQL